MCRLYRMKSIINKHAKIDYICPNTQFTLNYLKNTNNINYYKLYDLTSKMLLIRYILIYNKSCIPFVEKDICNIDLLTNQVQTLLKQAYDDEAKYYHYDFNYPFRHNIVIKYEYIQYKKNKTLQLKNKKNTHSNKNINELSFFCFPPIKYHKPLFKKHTYKKTSCILVR